MFWLLGLPFLGIAIWQDLKSRKIDDVLAYGMFAVAFATLILANPLPYDFLHASLIHGMFLAAALAMGWFFEGAGAWKSGDTLVFAAAAFLCSPVDIFIFTFIALAVLLAYNVPLLLKKTDFAAGMPTIAIIFVLYNMMVM